MTSAGVTTGPYRTAGEVERVVAGFEAGTLTDAEWSHRAHLTVPCGTPRITGPRRRWTSRAPESSG